MNLSQSPSRVQDPEALPDLETSLRTIGEHQRRLCANRQHALLLVVHGPDACGKDSLIRTLATYMDPAGFHAWSFGRPTGNEARHDFLWRVTPLLPGFGEVTAFNRSHHEAVIAERAWPVWHSGPGDVEGRYRSLREFEQHLVREGTCILKLWLHLSEPENRKRLRKRLDKPHKHWKFDPADIEAWQRRDELLGYAGEAIEATHIPEAPWHIIPADSKPEARAMVAGLLADTLTTLAPEYPAADNAVLSRYRALLDNQSG